jgi:hypothetical protein
MPKRATNRDRFVTSKKGKPAVRADSIQAAVGSPPLSHKRILTYTALFMLAALLVAGALQFCTPNAPETDAYYHLYHARLYAQHGPFLAQFPWLTMSVIGSYGADLWYGFHLLLLPFTFIGDGFARMKLAGTAITTAFLLLGYFIARRHRLALPFIWPFWMLFGIGVSTLRFAMIRPQVLSAGLVVLLFSLMVEGSMAGIFLTGLLITWIHLSVFWLGILVAALAAMLQLRVDKAQAWRKLGIALAGMLAGWLLRPHPLGALKLLFIQIFDLIKIQGSNLAIVPPELRPFNTALLKMFFGDNVLSLFLLPLLWIAGLVAFIIVLRQGHLRQAPWQIRVIILGSFGLSLLFLIMTTGMSLRSIDYWVPFAVLFTGSTINLLLITQPSVNKKQQSARLRRFLLPACAAVVLLMTIFSTQWYFAWMADHGEKPFDRERPAALWLRNHTKPSDIVYNGNADAFGELSFWGAPNRFVCGMDMVFTYARDRAAYWKIMLMENPGMTIGKTWGKADVLSITVLNPADFEDDYTVMKREFGAKYLFLRKRMFRGNYDYSSLYYFASSDPRFSLRFSNETTAIFELRDQK